MFFGALLHGSLWIQNHLVWDLPILGQQKETSGVASLGLLGVIVLSSLRPARRWFYEVFWIIQWVLFSLLPPCVADECGWLRVVFWDSLRSV